MRSLRAILLAAALVGVMGCHRTPSSEDQVREFCERFVHDSLALAPIEATAAGYHRHANTNLDEQLDDYSEQGILQARKFYDYSLGMASRLASPRLSEESRADLDIIRQQCELELLKLSKLQDFRHNPALYVEGLGNALYTPFILHYAPDQDRYANITARIEKIPAFLNTAIANLGDSPTIWNEVAQQENEGNITLIDKTIREKIPAGLKTRYEQAAIPAVAALKSFSNFLRNDLSRRTSDWRLGREDYTAKFRAAFATRNTLEQTLSDAERTLQAIRERMHQQAVNLYGKYYPGRRIPSETNAVVSQVLAKIADVHARPTTYFQTAKDDLAEATAFVKAHHLLSLPGKSNLEVIPTPEFMRGLYSVGGFSPAPVLEPGLGSFYWITPFTADMTPERIESKLREYNRYGLQLLTVHEAMPGHYVQFEYADDVQPEYRRVLRGVFADGPYVEGWAVHATEMMIDAGYQKSPEMQLTWEKHLLRVASNAILDIKLQTEGMTDGQALDLMRNQTFQEQEEAEGKLRRAKLSSCQLPTYFVGWRAWDDLERDYRDKKGMAFRLDRFNESALREGAVPLPVLSKLLFLGGS